MNIHLNRARKHVFFQLVFERLDLRNLYNFEAPQHFGLEGKGGLIQFQNKFSRNQSLGPRNVTIEAFWHLRFRRKYSVAMAFGARRI